MKATTKPTAHTPRNLTLPANIPFPAPPKPDLDCAKLLGQWGIDYLGNLDEVAGLNTLTAFCGVLSNIAGPGADLVSKDGSVLPAGLNWITAGGHSAELLRRHALDQLSYGQTGWLQNALRLQVIEDQNQQLEQVKGIGNRQLQEDTENLKHLLSSDANFMGMNDSEILLENRNSPKCEFKLRPQVYFEGSAPEVLEKALLRCHMGHPYVSFSPTSPAHFSQVIAAHRAITDGRELPSGDQIRGNTTIIASIELIAELLVEGNRDFDTDTLVLADVPSGGLRSFSRSRERLGSSRIEERFSNALATILHDRIGGNWYDGRKVEVEWRGALLTLRKRILEAEDLDNEVYPVACRLFAFLTSGMSRMAWAEDEQLPIDLGGLVSLTILLLRRSAYALKVIPMKGKKERHRAVAESLVSKLGAGPQTAGELCRRHHLMRVNECREVLGLLISAEVVSANGDVHDHRTQFELVG